MARLAFLLPLVYAAVALGSPFVKRVEPDPSLSTSVTIEGQTFINKVRLEVAICASFTHICVYCRDWLDLA